MCLNQNEPSRIRCRGACGARGDCQNTHDTGVKTGVLRAKCDYNLKLLAEAIQPCHESRPLKTAGSKKREPAKSIGNGGGPISPSGSGERSERTTVQAALPGSFFRTTTRVRALIAGEKTASGEAATVTK